MSLNKCFEKIEKPASNGSQRKGCLWAMNPNKIQKMNEEVQKWSRKDPQAIKKGMAMPGTSSFSIDFWYGPSGLLGQSIVYDTRIECIVFISIDNHHIRISYLNTFFFFILKVSLTLHITYLPSLKSQVSSIFRRRLFVLLT